MYKQNMIHIYIWWNIKKEVNSDTYYNMDEPWGHYDMKKKFSVTKKCDFTYMRYWNS